MKPFRKWRQSIFTLISLHLFILLFVSTSSTNTDAAYIQSIGNSTSYNTSYFTLPQQENTSTKKRASGAQASGIIPSATPTSGTQTSATPTPGTTTTTGPDNTPTKLFLNGKFPNYFSFGVMNGPGEVNVINQMRASNGTSYAFRYQYFNGGVNTGTGWETWNQPTGESATLYMNESAQNGYIPTFVYYEITPSNCGAGGSMNPHAINQNAYNIGCSSLMNAYYANWTLLLQKIAAFGKPALVIVEPDLWGFLQLASSGTNNAASVPASVSSSGNPDAAGFPNTVQGFAWALLHMRDKYAPNAILAIHASSWSAGADITTNTSPNVDVAGVVRNEANFLNSAGLKNNPAGVSTWDLISNDVCDHDAGQLGGSSWWDRTNKTFPNFSRYLTFIHGLSQATGRRIVMWQVPVGNQYFDTENNTAGHYQDNRAEYILANVSAFAAAGIVAVLFGPGNGGTTIKDAMHDGITNPAPISSYECNFCNTHRSSYADDDGGYLRIFIGLYMKHPVALS